MEERLKTVSKIKKSSALLLTVLFVGTIGYVLIEGATVLDALFMTIITISTIGYGEVFVLSRAGIIFSIFLIIAGVGTVGYTLGSLLEFMVEGKLLTILGRRRMMKDIDVMLGHYILCGYGRVGQNIAGDLLKSKARFIVIEKSPEVADKLIEEGFTVLVGDATNEEVLKAAGIDRARGLVTALNSDAENLYVTLMARELAPHLFIVSRSNSEGSETKLRRAGADRVISPHAIGGRRMAAMLLKPLVWDYLDLLVQGESIEFNVEDVEWRLDEVEVSEGSFLDGKTIEGARVYSNSGALVLAVKKRGCPVNTKPSKETLLEKGDNLIAIGTVDQLSKLEEISSKRASKSSSARDKRRDNHLKDDNHQ